MLPSNKKFGSPPPGLSLVVLPYGYGFRVDVEVSKPILLMSRIRLLLTLDLVHLRSLKVGVFVMGCEFVLMES